LRIDSDKPAKANVALDAGTLAAIDEETARAWVDARRAFMASAAPKKIRRGT